LSLRVVIDEGRLLYTVAYDGAVILEPSPPGLRTDEGDFTSGLSFVEKTGGKIEKEYSQESIKRSRWA
jgi:hypothetical protein